MTYTQKNNARLEAYNANKAKKVADVTAHFRGDAFVTEHFRGGVHLEHDVYGVGRVKLEDFEKGGFVAFYPSTAGGRRHGTPVRVSAKRLKPAG